VARGSGPGAGTVGREVVLERGARAGSVTREWTSGGSAVFLSELGRRRDWEGNRRGEGGGSGHGGATWREGDRGGLAPTGGRRPDSVRAGRDPDAAHRVAVRTEAQGGPRWQ
jgi:hypothetical protein